MTNRITQVATCVSLTSGNYCSMRKIKDIPACNIGIGTFADLDGELMLVDGQYYQLRYDGNAYVPEPDAGTPFAVCADFQPTLHIDIPNPIDLATLQSVINAALPEHNLPIMFRVNAEFETVHYRSIPKQGEEFVPFPEVIKNQSQFHDENVSGVLVGFRFPQYFSAFNLVGYHIHYIDQERKRGGHILGLKIKSGRIDLAESSDFNLLLPGDNHKFTSSDLSSKSPVSFNSK